jgi:hypothetical protein
MKKLSRLLPSLCGALLLLATGCNSRSGSSSISPPPAGVQPVVARFFLEVPNGDPDTARPLPASGLRVPIDPSSPVLNEGDIAGVRMGVAEHEGPYIVFQLTGDATRDFTRLTASHQGLHLVMTLNGIPLAATPIKGPISNGVLAVYPEGLTADVLADTANGINYVSGEIQKQLRR